MPGVERNKSTRTYIEDLKERLEHTKEVVKQFTDKAKQKQKELYDKKAKAIDIEVGDTVLVKILAREGRHKIADKFES